MARSSGLKTTEESAGADLVDDDCGPAVSLFDLDALLVSSPNSYSSLSSSAAPIFEGSE